MRGKPLHVVRDTCIRPSDSAGTVVLLGSLGSDTSMWQPQVAALTTAFDVLRVDHRGHGASPAATEHCALEDLTDDLLATLDRERVDRAALVGLSLGGMVAMSAALLAPQRFPSLVVLCSSAHLPPALGWLERADRVLAEGPESVAQDVVGRWFTPSYATAHPDVVDRMVTMIGRCSRDGYAGCCHAIAGMDLLPRLPELGSSLLAIAGERDATTPPDHLTRVVAAAPNARMAVVAGAHLASWECADEVNDLILDHLAGPLSSRGDQPRV